MTIMQNLKRFAGSLAGVFLFASGLAANPVWTFGLDDEGRLGLVSVEAADAESLAVPATSGETPVRAIGPNAFVGCGALKNVSVPATIEWIDQQAFAGCGALTGIWVDEDNAVYSDMDGALCDAEGHVLLTVPPGLSGSYTVPEGITAIDEGAFSECALLTEIVLRPGILDIRPTAFTGCDGLLSVLAPLDCDYDLSELGLPEGCVVTYYQAGGLDDPTLPPRWAAIFKANGGSGNMAEQIFLAGVAGNLRVNAFSRTGHTFAGWALSADGAVAFSDGQSVSDLAEAGQRTSLFAKWTPNRYTLVLNPHGGSGTMAPLSLTWGTAQALPANAYKRTGYVFTGWATTPSGAVLYKDRQTVKNLCATANGTTTLYAKWQGVDYYVVLHELPSGGKTYVQRLRYGTKAPLHANFFSRSGQVFLGWARSPNGPVAYRDKQEVLNLVTTAGVQVHLYAQWAVRNYKVRFMVNHGRGYMADQAHVYGQWRTLSPNAFSRVGYSFAGWSTTPSGSVLFSNGQSVASLTRNGGFVILYARWRPNRYTIVFDANGGTGTMVNQALSFVDKVRLRPNGFSRANYVFVGWSKTKGGKAAFADGAYVQSLADKNGAVVRLYARWAVRNYSVRFNANGGTGSMADLALLYDVARALPANAFKRDGYEFVGWSTSASSGTASFADRATVKGLTEGGGVVTLYAVWRRTRNPNLIVCLGDSITEGYRCIGAPYPTRLSQMSGRPVRNYGKGGKLSQYGASIVEDTLKKELPGTVCILFGANDAIHDVNPAVTKSNLRKIIRTCKKYDARPIIATPTPQIGSHERFNKNVNSIVKQVRTLAREEGVTLVDLNSAFGDGKKYLNPADGLHLNDAGGKLMAQSFRRAL